MNFLFAPINARGFGLMRILWAATALLFLLAQWQDIAFFYSDSGFIPPAAEPYVTRSFYRFTLLHWFNTSQEAFGLYIALLASLFFAMLGVLPRLTTILSFVLLISFHERNPLVLGGGDTVLRVGGFLLCVAPTLRALSLSRLREQWKHWRKERTLLPELKMSIWPYRLLLWQVIIIYVASLYYKYFGTAWWDGSATSIVLQLEQFARWPHHIVAFFAALSPVLTYGTIVFEAVWILLLIPRSVTRAMYGWEFQPVLKRWLLLIGVIFHLGIFLLMDIGSFSIAMLALYAGLLLDEDWQAMSHRKISVFYDGHCGLCLRSLFFLRLLDWFQRLVPIDFRDAAARKAAAADLSLEDLDRAMHIRFADGTTLSGFAAFRALAWHLPALWPLAPFLYLPGVPWLGKALYARIAARRKRCDHESCTL